MVQPCIHKVYLSPKCCLLRGWCTLSSSPSQTDQILVSAEKLFLCVIPSLPAGNLCVLALRLNALLTHWLVKTGLGFVLVSAGYRVGMKFDFQPPFSWLLNDHVLPILSIASNFYRVAF